MSQVPKPSGNIARYVSFLHDGYFIIKVAHLLIYANSVPGTTTLGLCMQLSYWFLANTLFDLKFDAVTCIYKIINYTPQHIWSISCESSR